MANRLSKIRKSRARHVRGAATVELCVAAPLLLFLLAAGADFARVYSYAQTLTHCAWNGAAFAANPDLAESYPKGTVEEVARIGTESFDRPPDVTVSLRDRCGWAALRGSVRLLGIPSPAASAWNTAQRSSAADFADAAASGTRRR